jgi:uncharacterized protein YqjF (DUF2071 family)
MGMSTSPPRILQATAYNRVVVGYAVDPGRVASFLPDGLVPIERDGTAYVSLVGVELTKVRVLGLVPPTFRRVPAVELRVHVRPAEAPTDQNGTWTVQAHVPRLLVAWGARLLYGESVAVTSMQPIRREQDDSVEVTYRFDWRGREQRIRARGEQPPVTPPSESIAHTLVDPGWRFATAQDGALLRTRIERPAAPIYRVQEHHVTVDWASVYGEMGELVEDQPPAHVLLSPGTPVALRWRERVP